MTTYKSSGIDKVRTVFSEQLSMEECYIFPQTDTDKLCCWTDLIQWVKSQLGAHHTDLQHMDGCPGKVTKPLNHKGTLATTLSWLLVVMAMLTAQLAADWLLAHPVCGLFAWGGSSVSLSSAGFVYIVRGAGERGRERNRYEEIMRNVYENWVNCVTSGSGKTTVQASEHFSGTIKNTCIQRKHVCLEALQVNNIFETM